MATKRFTAPTTTDDYQAWAHGFAMTASLYAARSVLAELVERPGQTLPELCMRVKANSGHLAIMLRTLSTVGWVTMLPGSKYKTTKAVAECAASGTLATLCVDVYGEEEKVSEAALSAEAWGRHLPRLAKHLKSIQSGWALPASASEVPLLPLMLAGAVITPLLLELRMVSSSYTAKGDAAEHEHASSRVSLAKFDASVAQEVADFFAFQRWGEYDAASSILTLKPDGLFIIERCPAFGVCLSYRPMLNLLSEATFGDVQKVFTYEGEHEGWVDRKLNVIGSGFMHNRYFADMMKVHVGGIFDQPDLEKQPRAVADMGCGDGTLLKTIYAYVAQHTLRGKHLGQYPLTMIGVDFNKASEEETTKTLELAGVPTHGTMFGDIGDPIPMQAALERKFGVTRDQVLHVRSFLDHDRPFIAPIKPSDPTIEDAFNSSDAAYVENKRGSLVTPSLAFYSLVEHFERWAACLGSHGLLVLEVSNLDCVTTRKYMNEATSMHFDCVQMHSGQILMPPTHFSLGAATAGLLPSAKTLTYPKDSAYTRIVLQQLKPAGVKIRLATLGDMPHLVRLEAFWKQEDLQADEPTLRRRLTAHPTGQFVVESPDGQLLAAMYTQRVPSYERLLTCKRDTELELHTPTGPVIQLLGVVQAPDAARVMAPIAASTGETRSVGQILRDYVLHLGRLDATAERACGVTRCRDFEPKRGRTYEEHVRICDDAGLKFHSDAGATIGELVPNYRRGDPANSGYGVMICYELKGAKSTQIGTAAAAKAQASAEVAKRKQEVPEVSGPPATIAQAENAICKAIDDLRYGDEPTVWTLEKKNEAFMDLGIDSLDATKFVQNLNSTLGLDLSNTIIFEEPNVKELAKEVLRRLKARAPTEPKRPEPKRPEPRKPEPPTPVGPTSTHWIRSGQQMAPPTDDDFYMRGKTIPQWQMRDVAMKERGVPEELVSLWSAQREAKAVITQKMVEEALSMTDCF